MYRIIENGASKIHYICYIIKIKNDATEQLLHFQGESSNYLHIQRSLRPAILKTHIRVSIPYLHQAQRFPGSVGLTHHTSFL